MELLCCRYSVAQNLEQVASDLEKPISDVTVLILDRPRHTKLINQCRETGARLDSVHHHHHLWAEASSVGFD